MSIEWNKVTWYSKVLAVIVFVATMAVGFYLGREYESQRMAEILQALVRDAERNVVIKNTSGAVGASQRIANFNTAVEYSCADGARVVAKFGDRLVSLTLPDSREFTLEQTVSASGARYANEGDQLVFWNKGTEASVEENGTMIYADCVAR